MTKTHDLLESSSRIEPNPSMACAKGSMPPRNAPFPGRPSNGKAAKESIKRDVNRRIEKAIAFMLGNLEKPLCVAEVGKVAGMSTSHFHPLFKTATGRTPNDFITCARIRRACDMLEQTQLSVKEIAAKLGYGDQFYFSRVFKLLSTMPPTSYRTLNSPLQQRVKGGVLGPTRPLSGGTPLPRWKRATAIGGGLAPANTASGLQPEIKPPLLQGKFAAVAVDSELLLRRCA